MGLQCEIDVLILTDFGVSCCEFWKIGFLMLRNRESSAEFDFLLILPYIFVSSRLQTNLFLQKDIKTAVLSNPGNSPANKSHFPKYTSPKIV